MKTQHKGGTAIGFIVGVIVGLGVALAVAAYVTRMPVPFLYKGNGRSADTDAAESRKNRDWDPNLPLYGKNPVRPAPAVTAVTETATAAASVPAPDTAGTTAEPRPAASQSGTKATAKTTTIDTRPDADPFDYFVQVGAFRSQGDADTQRAKLALLGWEARVSEREQNGRAVFRVRVGPFTKRDDAEQLKEKLDGAAIESTLVRVPHQAAAGAELFTGGMAPIPQSKTRPKVFDETP